MTSLHDSSSFVIHAAGRRFRVQGRRVLLAAAIVCVLAVISASPTSAAVTTTTYGTSISVAINDCCANGPYTDNTATINVSDPGKLVSNVDVIVRLNHTFDGDLSMYLQGPDGTQVLLVNRRGGSGDNYGSGANNCSTNTPTIFTSSGSHPNVSGAGAPFTNTYNPEGDLGDFHSKAVSGAWTLHVRDNATNDVGTIGCFQVVITAFDPVTASGKVYADVNINGNLDGGEPGQSGWTVTLYFCGFFLGGCVPAGSQNTNGSGDYSFSNLGVGFYYVFLTQQGNWQPTSPVQTPFFFVDGVTTNYTNNFGQSRADISVAVTDSVDPVSPGAALQYNATATNNGPTAASNVRVTITWPIQLQNIGGYCYGIQNACFYDGTNTVYAVANRLDPGQTVGVGFNSTVDPATPDNTTISASAVTTSNMPDPNTGNNSASQSTLVRRSADLAVTKTGDTSVFIGDNISYQIKLQNNGPDEASGLVSVTDTVPLNTTLVSSSGPTGWTCADPGAGGTGLVNCTQTFASGTGFTGSATFSIIVKTNSDLTAGTTISNSARGSSVTFDGNLNNNFGSTLTTLKGKADIKVTQTVNPNPTYAGNASTFNVTVQNDGPDSGSQLVFDDSVPVSMTFKSLTPAPNWTCPTVPAVGATGNIHCTVAQLDKGANSLFIIQFNVDPFVPDGTTLINTATATSSTFDPAAGNNQYSQPVLIANQADLSLTVAPSPNPVIAGNDLTYLLTVNTVGPSTAPNVRLTDTLPVSVTGFSVVTNRGTCNITTLLICDLGNMTPGFGSGTAFITLKVHVRADTPDGASLFNEAAVTSGTVDPSLSNNLVDSSTQVQARSNVAITQSDNPDPVVAGTNLTYTLAITNVGPSYATGVIATDTLPVSTTLVSIGTTLGSCNNATLVCSFGTMADDVAAYVTVVVFVSPAKDDGSTITNGAKASTTAIDPDSSNDSSSETTTVIGRPDLSITKYDSPDPVVAGSILTYTLRYTNAGPSYAQNVTISDTLPTATSLVTVSTPLGTCAAGPLIYCQVGTITNGVSSLIIVTTTVDINTRDQTTISNTAAITTSNVENNLANNQNTQSTLVLGLADLSVLKLDAPDPVPAGTNLIYTLIVTNSGPSAALNTVLVDPLPTEMTANSAIADGGQICTGTTTVSCALGTMEKNAVVIITINAAVIITPPVTGIVTNTVAVSSSTIDTDAANNVFTETTRVIPRADLSVFKRDLGLPAVAGLPLTYTVVVTNNGPHAAQNVQVLDILPANAQLITVSTPVNWSCDSPLFSGIVSCITPLLPNGAVAVIPIVAFVDPSTPDGSSLDNGVLVNSDTYDIDGSNNIFTRTTQVAARPDLSITKIATPNPAVAGTMLTYTVIVSNAGPSTANSVRMADTLSDSLALLNIVPSAGTCSGTVNLVCNFGRLLPLDSAQATITVLIDPSIRGKLVNVATVSSNEADPNTINNTAVQTTTVVGVSDLLAIKLESPNPVIAGTALTYTVWITNLGPSTATQIRLTDTLPAGLSAITMTSASASCVLGPAPICNIGTMLPKARVVISMTAMVDPTVRGIVTNTVKVTSAETDPVPVNSTAYVTTQVDSLIDLTLSKTGAPDPVIAGTAITYTLVVSNSGPSAGLQTVVTDALPLVTAVVATASQGSCAVNGVLTCTIGTVLPNRVYTITVRGLVDPSSRGSIINSANVGSPDTEPNGTNNSAEVTTGITALADVWVTKTAVNRGFVFTYTIVINNAGPSTANNYQINDLMPTGVTLNNVLNPAGTCDTSSGLKCTLSALRPGNTAVITIVARPQTLRPAVYTNTVSISATENDPNPANNTASASATIYGSYMPTLLNLKANAPDLIVARMLVTQGSAQVVIKNVGSQPVVDSFWVDIYVNPNPAPNAVNEVWYDGRSTQGAAWGVQGAALPIAPNQEITLTIGDAYYSPPFSSIQTPWLVGTAIWAQVDAVDLDTNHGGVLEVDEILGLPYNNILGPVLVPAGAASVRPPTPPANRPGASNAPLPRRQSR